MIVMYTRQSVDKKDSISIDGQIEFCKKELKENEDYKVYTDRGFSGKDTNRPAFEKMMNDVRKDMVSRVIVYKLDRISRSTLDFANIIDTFTKHNVDFTSSTEKFDTSTPIGRAMLQIIMVFAQLERETIQRRIIDNYYLRGRKGFYLGGKIPYGFYKEKTEINGNKTSVFKPNFEQSIHVEEMYKLYAETDMSLGKISSYFNEKGVPSKENKNWDSGKISRMLKSPLYVKADADVYLYYRDKGAIISNELTDFIGVYGCYMYGKRSSNERKYTNVKDHVLTIAPHEGLVDSKTWLLCQYKLDNNKQLKNSGKGKYSWLSGKTKCGYCGYSVTAMISDGKYKYFKCKGKYNLKVCNGHSQVIKVDNIETQVEKELLNEISKHKDALKNKTIKKKDNYSSNKYKLELIEIDNQIENLINQIAESNDVVIKYINEKINKLDNRKVEILEKLKNAALNDKPSMENNSVFKLANAWDKLSLEDKKMIGSMYINKIIIKDDTIEIDWKTTE